MIRRDTKKKPERQHHRIGLVADLIVHVQRLCLVYAVRIATAVGPENYHMNKRRLKIEVKRSSRAPLTRQLRRDHHSRRWLIKANQYTNQRRCCYGKFMWAVNNLVQLPIHFGVVWFFARRSLAPRCWCCNVAQVHVSRKLIVM
jgi:hypothetical protein